VRIHSNAITVLTGAIAAYLGVQFGAAAFRVLGSPIYGLEDYGFARMIFASGRLLDLSPNGISLLAARFGALQLVIAVLLLLASLDRARALWGREADSDLLEAGLIMAAAASVASLTPALAESIPGLARHHGFHLALVALAAALSLFERVERRESRKRETSLHLAARQAAADAMTQLPAVRRSVTPRRWALLRRWANPVVH
jgi:hypothetical protein